MVGLQDEKAALADAVKGALAAARTAAQNGTGADATANGHATDEAALEAVLAKALEEREAQQVRVAPDSLCGGTAACLGPRPSKRGKHHAFAEAFVAAAITFNSTVTKSTMGSIG